MQVVRLLNSRGSKVGRSNGLMASKSVYKSGAEVHKNSLKISCRLPAREAITKKSVLLSHLPTTTRQKVTKGYPEEKAFMILKKDLFCCGTTGRGKRKEKKKERKKKSSSATTATKQCLFRRDGPSAQHLTNPRTPNRMALKLTLRESLLYSWKDRKRICHI